MTARQTVAQGSEDYLKLLEYIQDQPPGVLLNYQMVWDSTGVLMDRRGRDRLRRAIRRSNREYSVVPNVGYKLANAEMVMGILSFKLMRIDNTVKNADRSHLNLQRAFLAQLTQEEARGVLFIGAVFGAIRLAAENGKRLYRKPLPALLPSSDKPVILP